MALRVDALRPRYRAGVPASDVALPSCRPSSSGRLRACPSTMGITARCSSYLRAIGLIPEYRDTWLPRHTPPTLPALPVAYCDPPQSSAALHCIDHLSSSSLLLPSLFIPVDSAHQGPHLTWAVSKARTVLSQGRRGTYHIFTFCILVLLSQPIFIDHVSRKNIRQNSPDIFFEVVSA